MRFKDFLQLELDGLFGNIKAASGNLNLIQKQIKEVKPVKGKGTTAARHMNNHISAPKPATPAALVSYKKPATIPSLLS